MELTDRELVAMACKGDADAFGELVKRYASAVYGVAYHKIGDFHLAHDIAQEAFIRAYLALTDLKDPARVGSWLYSITSRLCVDWLRKKRASCSPIEDFADVLEAQTVEEHVVQGETREAVWKALDSLPETSRLTTILYYIDGYTTRDISSFLGVSVKAVENRLRRARQKLKREMISVIEGNLKQHGDEFERKIEGLLSEVKKLQAVGKQKEALEAIRKAVDMKPDDMSLRRILANVLFTLGSVEQDKVILSEAEAEFRKVLAHDPGAYLGLGYIYLWRGETDKAIEHFQKLLRQPSLEWKIALAQAINEKGEREEYIRLFQEAAAESLGLLLFSLSELARAMRAAKDKRMEYRYCETLVRVVEATGRDGSTLSMGWNGYLDLAELQLEDGNTSEALTSIRHARDIARLATGEVSSSLFNKVPMEAVRSFQCTEIELFLEYLNQKRFDALRGNPEFERLIVETKTEVETERDKTAKPGIAL